MNFSLMRVNFHDTIYMKSNKKLGTTKNYSFFSSEVKTVVEREENLKCPLLGLLERVQKRVRD